MAKVKELDKVKIVTREVTPEDRKTNQYFDHMAGLTGMAANIYVDDEIAVQVDIDSLSHTARAVHTEAVRRLRAKFVENASEEAKSKLTPEELNFDAHYMVLAQGKDLEKA